MLKTAIKILFAVAILYWLVSNGKLDFGLVLEIAKHPVYFIMGVFLISLQLLFGAFRLGILLKIKSRKFTGWELIRLQWIGQLFSTVLPGAFTSDLVKIGYIKNIDSQLSKSYILFMILIDRLIGLNSLLFISGITSLIFYQKLLKLNSVMEKVVTVNIALFVISVTGMSLVFLKESHHEKFLRLIPFEKMRMLAAEIWKLKAHAGKFFIAYVISIVGHVLAIIAFWVVSSPFLKFHVDLDYFFTLVPLGQLAVVIPISPGGIGVGHAAFSTLFGFIGQSNGASLYNLYWVMGLVISLFGIIPFILNKKRNIED